jgi:glycosyltransferase involved in cell wall biosynthesis
MTAPARYSAVLTHHWLVRRRGGERVLAALAELLPHAPVYTLVHDPNCVWQDGDAESAAAPNRRIHTSWLQHLPGAARHYPKLLPLLPLAARSVHLPPVDLVVCSDAAIAKAMRPAPRSRVLCYCHSPVRYAWEPEMMRVYAGNLPRALRPLWPALAAYIRRADAAAARRVDRFIANSQHVAARIRRCYGRESTVVYPPVDVPDRPSAGPRVRFLLCVGHHVAYKRLDLAVAATKTLGWPLVVIGDGPDVPRLAPGNPHVSWLGWQPDAVVQDHYRRAAALLFPGEEDFGIVPVEAQAHGCPVIAYGVGGACETVVDGITGVLFPQQTEEALVAAIRRAADTRFDPDALHTHARRFSRARFMTEMSALIDEVLAQRAVAPDL